MDREQFQRYLSERIPITGAGGMAFVVTRYDAEQVTMRAPLDANLNDKRTAFGGSIASLLTIASWGMATRILDEAGLASQVVIQRCEVEYLRPILTDFEATAQRPASSAVERYLKMLRQFGRSRIEVEASIGPAGQTAARFRGSFAALRPDPTTKPDFSLR